VIFVDSNIPMYLVGAAHPNKGESRRLLDASIAAGERLVTDSEVFQEILHGYAAIGRKDAIVPAFEALLGVVDEVFPIELAQVVRAREILLSVETISARDALHIAEMERHGATRIMSFDTGFDGILGVERMR
jgi:uncharacterized protein